MSDADLADLVDRCDDRAEGNRVALLEELEARGAAERAGELARSDAPADRLLAARVIGLLPGEGHVASLSALVDDGDPDVAATARAALRVQVRTPEWQALVRRLAADGDAQAEGWLAER